MAQFLHQTSKENNGHCYFPGSTILADSPVTLRKE